jgi:hypothetical protein
VRLAVAERLAGRLAVPPVLLKNQIAAPHERDEFNAQTCITASKVIRQLHCPNATHSLPIVFKIRERKFHSRRKNRLGQRSGIRRPLLQGAAAN